jgi:hypothetical protein
MSSPAPQPHVPPPPADPANPEPIDPPIDPEKGRVPPITEPGKSEHPVLAPQAGRR